MLVDSKADGMGKTFFVLTQFDLFFGMDRVKVQKGSTGSLRWPLVGVENKFF